MGANEPTVNKSPVVDHAKGKVATPKPAQKRSSGMLPISIIAAILAMFIAYQYNANLRTDAQLAQLQNSVGDLLVLVQKNNNYKVTDTVVKDFERETLKETPHAKYKITPSKHDPNVPADPDREYSNQ